MKIRTGILIVLAIFVGGLFMSAQAAPKEEKQEKIDVPKAVYDAFVKAYPDAKIVASGKEKKDHETVFEIESKDGKVSRNVLYREDGTLVEIEEKIPPTSLPLEVLEAINTKFPTGETVKAEKIMRGETTEFELRLRQEGDYYEVVVSPDGKIAKTTQLTHQDEEEDSEIENE